MHCILQTCYWGSLCPENEHILSCKPEGALTSKFTNNKQFLEGMVAGVAESAVLGLTIQKISGQQPLSSISFKTYGMGQKKLNQSILIRSL